jgi:hypothetical protein
MSDTSCSCSGNHPQAKWHHLEVQCCSASHVWCSHTGAAHRGFALIAPVRCARDVVACGNNVSIAPVTTWGSLAAGGDHCDIGSEA